MKANPRLLTFTALALGALAFASCAEQPPALDLLRANFLNTAVQAARSRTSTVAVSGRLSAPGGSALNNARLVFSQGSGPQSAWSCNTDSNGFWSLDMTVPGGDLTFSAVVEKNGVRLAEFRISIVFVAGSSGTYMRVITTVVSGDIQADAVAYLRSSLLISGNPSILTEGQQQQVAVKFNQAQSESQEIEIISNQPELLSINGLDSDTLIVEAPDATTDHFFTLAAKPDADVSSQSATITLRSSNIPDVVFAVLIEDADQPTMVVSGGNTLAESSGATVFWVRPGFVPDQDLTLAIATSNPGKLSATPASVTFTPTNYLTPQPITVSAGADADWTDDLVDLTFAAPALAAPMRHSITILDNDVLFPSTTTLSVGPLSGVAACDLDQDGRADLLSTGSDGAALRIFRSTSGPGGASFEPALVVPISAAGAAAVDCADFDQDGRSDIVIVHSASGTLEFVRNLSSPGALGFAAPVSFAVGADPRDVALADLDGDGKIDLVSAHRSAGQLSVLRNLSVPGSLSFSTSTIAVGMHPSFVRAADANGDGKPDLAVVHDFATFGSVTLLRNTATPGNISFATPVVLNYLAGFGLAWLDSDANGSAEFFTLSDASSQIRRIAYNDASNQYLIDAIGSGINAIPNPYFIRPLIGADLDADGRSDLALADPVGGRAVVYRSEADGGWSPGKVFLSGKNYSFSLSGDFDGDGKADLAFATLAGSIDCLLNRL